MRIPGLRRLRACMFRRKLLNYSRGLILTYHRVVDIKNDWQLLSISPENFEQQLQIIKREFHPISVEMMVKALKKGEVIDRCIALTFDDGYFDNFEFVKPLLEKYEVPATVYVASGFMDNHAEFYWDKLEYLFSEGKEYDWNVTDLPVSSFQKKYLQNCEELHKMNIDERKKYLIRIDLNPEEVRRSHRKMNSEEVFQCDQSPYFKVQAHTVNHPSLAYLSNVEQEREILTSKLHLEDLLKHEINGFAYPYGGINDFSKSTIEIIKRLGFEYAMANYPGPIWKGSNMYALPRFVVRNWKASEFKDKLFRWYNVENVVFNNL